MKTIENFVAGNAFVVVKSEGENLVCVVADKKHVGAVIAGMTFGTTNFGMCESAVVRAVDVKASIYKKISKITNNIAEAVTFAADAKEIAKLAEVLASEENIYDNNALINGYEFGSFRLFVAEKDGKSYLVKSSTAAKKAVEDALTAAGYTIVSTFVTKDQSVMQLFAAMNRANTKEGILNEYEVSAEVKDYVIAFAPAEEAKVEVDADETAAEETAAEDEAPAEQA